ncbi:MAG: c-type cytochrome [Planctomycetes bacterium]|nr:c-type cytochrome [Planctomycetota bacterium]
MTSTRSISLALIAYACLAQPAFSSDVDDLPAKQATPASAIRVARDFQVELVHTAAPSEGSWIALAIDDRGRLWIAPQDGEPLRRLTINEQGQLIANEPLPLKLSRAMGLLWMRESLYVSGDGPQGHGLYRVRDSDGDDVLDDARLLRRFAGRVDGEHGCHALVAGPDGMLYVAQGNHVLPPEDVSATSPYRHYAEDQLLPSANYGVSGGDKARMPCGHVLRMDADARRVELFAGGLRNAYDLAFNAAGELFTFDSDTEFSWGLPWHQPTRILHVVSGGDYGFREGTGKFPPYYEDTLPPAAIIGLGSPTGLKFGTRSRFSARYQRAMFAADWTLGRIYAVHFTEDGASYRGEAEIFLEGRPLNVTDLEFSPDGALYFTTGGRKTVGALYRVRYVGKTTGAPQDVVSSHPSRTERHRLERWQQDTANNLDPIWRRLGDRDRFTRYAARVAIEAQPVAAWRARAAQEEDPRTALAALLALARIGEPADLDILLEALARFPCNQLDPELLLAKLRVIQVALVRLGRPDAAARERLQAELDPLFPARDDALNRELAQVLIYLGTPDVTARVVEAARAATDVEQQITLLFYLRHAARGWSNKLRRQYFELFLPEHRAQRHRRQTLEWFAQAGLPYSDGASFMVYLTNIRDEAAQHLSATDRVDLRDVLTRPVGEVVPRPVFVPRSFVRAWSVADLLADLDTWQTSGDAQRGREVFAAAQCQSCHRFENRGGAAGPDLSAIAKRLSPRDVLESTLEPSRVVSDQFRNLVIECADGRTLVGRVVTANEEQLVIATDATGMLLETILRKHITRAVPSQLSPMPEGLLNSFTRQEVMDLLAYLLRGG